MHEPDIALDKREVVSDPLARVPLLILAWRAPPMGDPDWFPLQSLAEVLGAGEASRLLASLVKGAGVASGVSASLEDSPGPNFFTIIVTAVAGKDRSQIESLCNQEIERVAREGVPDTELERVRMNALRNRALTLVSSMARSVALARLEAFFANPAALNEWENQERRLSSDALRRVAARYLTPANRVELTVVPGESQ